MIKKCLVLISLSLLFITGNGLHGADCVVINSDDPNEGLNDPTPVSPIGGNDGTTLGQQRLNVLQATADVWGDLLNSDIDIRINAKFDTLPGTSEYAVLGTGGATGYHANFSNAPLDYTWYPRALANSLAGVDLNSGQDDINITFNSAIDGDDILGTTHWYYGLDGNRGYDIDLFTTALHELGHGLGFQTLVNLQTGDKGGTQDYDDCFMVHLEDHSLGQTWPVMTDAERANSATDTDDLHWVGGFVLPMYSLYSDGIGAGNHFEMYAPDPLQQGSSVAHWDKDLTPDELMEPSYTGFMDNPGLTVELMRDLGWELNPKLSIRLFLEGAWDNGSNTMRTDLYQNDDLPLTSPYEQDPVTVASIPDSIVDWVLLEVRSSPQGTAMAQNSAFISENGYITESGEDGGVILNIADGDYYAVVRHRNHLDVISATSVTLQANTTTAFDFSSTGSRFYGVHGGKALQSGVWGMIAGDINADGVLSTLDYSDWYNDDHDNLSGYLNSDCNLDGTVDTGDYRLWQSNTDIGRKSELP